MQTRRLLDARFRSGMVSAAGSILAGFPFKELFAGHGVEEFFREFAEDATRTSSMRCTTFRSGIACCRPSMMVGRLPDVVAVLYPPARICRSNSPTSTSCSTSSCSTNGILTSFTTSSSCVRPSGSAACSGRGGDGYDHRRFRPRRRLGAGARRHPQRRASSRPAISITTPSRCCRRCRPDHLVHVRLGAQ